MIDPNLSDCPTWIRQAIYWPTDDDGDAGGGCDGDSDPDLAIGNIYRSTVDRSIQRRIHKTSDETGEIIR